MKKNLSPVIKFLNCFAKIQPNVGPVMCNKGGRCLLSQMCESGIRAHVCYDLILIFLIGFDRMGVDFFRV